MPERQEATSHADTYHRHDDPPAGAEEQKAVTGRPPDTPQRGTDKPAVPNSTFAERAKARTSQADTKQVTADEAENKAVAPSTSRKK